MSETIHPSTDLKTCCAALYESDWARLLLGDSFHPGGLSLTERLGTLLGLKPGLRVLDVATGQGTSAIFLARRFGCSVVGLDYGAGAVAQANRQAEEAGLAHLVRFEQGDAEALPFSSQTFDAVICECAFCTFPNKPAAAAEVARVLRPGGRVGLSDLTRAGPLPPELAGLLAWVACLADAWPVETYTDTLTQSGLAIDLVEPHHTALAEIVQDVRRKLIGVELMIKLKKLPFPITNLETAKNLACSAGQAVQTGKLGYVIIVGSKLEIGD